MSTEAYMNLVRLTERFLQAKSPSETLEFSILIQQAAGKFNRDIMQELVNMAEEYNGDKVYN